MFRKLFVIRHRSYRKDFENTAQGYLDPELVSYNFFVKEILLFGAIRVYSKILHQEHVPNWAWIQEGTMGYTDWKSAAPRELWDLCSKH